MGCLVTELLDILAALKMLRRVVLPLGFITTIVVAAGCLQQASLREENSPQMVAVPVSTRVAEQTSQPGLGQEDPRLDMDAVTGRAASDYPTTLTIQVLPDGNVPETPPAVQLLATVTNTTITRWVSNSATTKLWSGPNAQASAFTELPSASYLRVTGPQDGSRVPVYYVGDGLFRRPGNGWVDGA